MTPERHKSLRQKNMWSTRLCMLMCLSVLLLSVPDKCFAGEITVDIGTDYINTYYGPIAAWMTYSYFQQIYLQSELNPGQSISIDSIGFYYQGDQGWTNSVVVYMGHTAATVFPSTTGWKPTSSMTQVYSGSYSVSTTTAWYKIGLSTPFVYNNSDNLCIAVDENTGTYQTSTSLYFWNNNCGANRSLIYYTDVTNPDPSSPPTGALSAYRPRLWLHYTLSSVIAGSGDCLNFDGASGSDYVRVSYASALAPTSYVSLEFWAWDDDWTTTQSGGDESIVSKMETGGYGIYTDAANIHAWVRRNGAYSTNATYATSSLSSGWHHFAMTYSGRYTRLYIDGTLVDTDDAGGSYSIQYTYSNALIIGGEAGTGTSAVNYFDGKIDEVRIWDDTRTQSEIEDNMYTALTGSESDLVGYWQFDEGTGTTVEDNTSVQQNGTMVNMEAADWQASEAWKNRTTDDDTPLTFCAGYDPDDDAITISQTVAPTNGALIFDHTNVEITYVPDFESSGADNFTYQVSDGTNTDTYAMTVTTSDVNASPVAGSGNCLDFDGSNDHVRLPDGGMITDDSWSLEFWIKPNSPDNFERIFIQGADYSGRQIMVLWYSDHIEFRTSTTGSAGIPQKATTAITDDNSTWTHVAWTFDGTTHNVYANGQISSGTVLTTNNGIGGDNYIGCREGTLTFWTGCLDEIRLWDDVRTQTEIQDNMHAALVGNEANLVGYWRFDESSGTTARDFSGDDNNGLLVNMTDGDWVASVAWKYRSMLINSSLSHSAGYDPDGDGLTITEVGGPTSGLSFDNPNRECDYSSGGSSGTVTYTYQVSDAKGSRATDTYDMEIDVTGSENYNDWNYSRQFTINTKASGAGVSVDVYDFPLLVRLDTSFFVFGQCKSDGSDIRFSKIDGTHLSYERERWSLGASDSMAEFWVLIDTVQGSDSTQTYTIYWGNASAGDSSNSENVFETTNSFEGVWHLSEETAGIGTADLYKDATSNDYDGDDSISATGQSEMVGKSHDFDGTDDRIHLPDGGMITGTEWTLGFWVKPDDEDVVFNRLFIQGIGGYASRQVMAAWDIADDQIEFVTATGASNTGSISTSTLTDDGNTWYYVVWTHTATTDTAFVDGVSSSGTLSGSWGIDGDNYIGCRLGTSYNFDGALDEVRISSAERSSDWVLLCYETQKSDQNTVIWPTEPEDYTDWNYSIEIYINTTSSGGDVDNDVLDFPLLVRLDNTILTFSQAETDGSDIRFAKSDGTHLIYERERWDDVNDEAAFWVKLDTVYGDNSTQYIKIHWGNSDCGDSSSAAGVFETADDFEAVWHLNEDPSDGSDAIVDRTTNNNDGTSGGTMLSADSVDANIGNGIDFDGTDDYINAGSGTSIDDVDPVTISAWIYPHGWGTGSYGRIVDKTNMLFFLSNAGGVNGTETFAFRFYRTTLTDVRAANYSLDLNEWAYITAVMNGTSSCKLYLNGSETSYLTQTLGSGAHTSDAASSLYIANSSGSTREYDGLLDELRISSAVRSADWIKLCYETQRQGQNTVISEKIDLLPLTVTHDIGTGTSDTVEISTDVWKIIFDENIGAGIKWLSYEGPGGGDNELDPTTNLFYVRANQAEAYQQNGKLTLVDNNSLFCHLRQSVTVNSIPFEIDYTIYGSGRMYIRVELDAYTSGYTLDNGGLQFRVESDVSNKEYYKENSDASLSNYILHSDKGSGKYDILLALYEDWADANGFTLATGDHYGYKCDPYTISAGNREAWEFLVDFGHRKWNDTAGVGGQVDDFRGPDSLELSKGFFRLEKAWEENMIGHWTFDEKTSGTADGDIAYDYSPASHNGVIEGGDWVAGQWNSALDLDGASDSVAIVSPDDFDMPMVFTIMAWIKKDGTGETNALIFGKHNPTAGEGYKVTSESNKLKLTFYNTSLTGTTALGTGWRHVAVSVNKHSGWAKLFVDGKYDGLLGVDPLIKESSVDVSIGNDFAGLIDDVRYYAKEISEETIRAVSQNGYRVNENKYMVRASNANTIELKIDGTGSIPRQFPVFQISNYWAEATPKAVYYDGAWQSTPSNYLVDLNDDYNILTIGFNAAVKKSDLRIYIDDNDSSGAYMTDPMPTMTWGTSGSDFYVQNFGSDKFGGSGSNEFYLYWKMSNTTGFCGELWRFKTSEGDPNEDVVDANNIIDTTASYTFGYHDNADGTNYANSATEATASATYTVLESTDVRIRLQINKRRIDDASGLDYDIVTRWTIYPTGQIFRYDTLPYVYVSDNTMNYEFIRFRTKYDGGFDTSRSASNYRAVVFNTTATHDHVLASLDAEDKNGTQLLQNGNYIQFQTDGSTYMGYKFDGNSNLPTGNVPFKYALYLDIQRDNMNAAYRDSVCKGIQTIATTSGDMITGELVTDATGDMDNDGYCEAEGAYILEANDNSVHLKLEADGATDGCQFNPAFRITNYTGIVKPRYVHLHDGSDTITLVDGYGYNSYLNDNDDELVIQIDSVFCADVYVYISCDDDLAVTMSNFYAIPGDGNDTLFWRTESESNNLGFWLYRRVAPPFYDSLASKIDSTTPESKLKGAGLLYKRGGLPCKDTLWTPVTKQIIPGAEGGTSAGPLEYSKIDFGVHNNVLYEYKLEMVDMSMERDEMGPISVMPIPMFPRQFMLFHNFPNPVKYYTIIKFDLPVKTPVSLFIYNLQGRLITRLIKPGKKWKPGWYKIRWDARNEYGRPLASGPYIYRLQAGKKYAKSRLMILVK